MAQIHDSIICENCGDPTMSTRIKEYNGKKVCIPCYQKLNN
ncbi:MAG: TraR/DksA C4-type zinc finger protein [Candidatus Hermodarchaeota archaeon]